MEGAVGDLDASGTTPDVTFPPTCLGGWGEERRSREPRLQGRGWGRGEELEVGILGTAGQSLVWAFRFTMEVAE